MANVWALAIAPVLVLGRRTRPRAGRTGGAVGPSATNTVERLIDQLKNLAGHRHPLRQDPSAPPCWLAPRRRRHLDHGPIVNHPIRPDLGVSWRRMLATGRKGAAPAVSADRPPGSQGTHRRSRAHPCGAVRTRHEQKGIARCPRGVQMRSAQSRCSLWCAAGTAAGVSRPASTHSGLLRQLLRGKEGRDAEPAACVSMPEASGPPPVFPPSARGGRRG